MTDKRATFDRMALGCISYLESFPECRMVSFQGNEPAMASELLAWERRNHPWKLPQDLRAFYSIFNGFNLSWSVEVGDKIETIGEMRLHKVDSITKCTSEFFVQEKLPEDISAPNSKTSTLFLLDPSCPLGEIVLLYRTPVSAGSASAATTAMDDPEVWLLDQSAQLTYMCKSFTHYLRLMVVHLGIKGWQSVFLDSGWSPATQQWMSLFCKERLVVDRHYRNDSLSR